MIFINHDKEFPLHSLYERIGGFTWAHFFNFIHFLANAFVFYKTIRGPGKKCGAFSFLGLRIETSGARQNLTNDTSLGGLHPLTPAKFTQTHLKNGSETPLILRRIFANFRATSCTLCGNHRFPYIACNHKVIYTFNATNYTQQ